MASAGGDTDILTDEIDPLSLPSIEKQCEHAVEVFKTFNPGLVENYLRIDPDTLNTMRLHVKDELEWLGEEKAHDMMRKLKDVLVPTHTELFLYRGHTDSKLNPKFDGFISTSLIPTVIGEFMDSLELEDPDMVDSDEEMPVPTELIIYVPKGTKVIPTFATPDTVLPMSECEITLFPGKLHVMEVREIKIIEVMKSYLCIYEPDKVYSS